MTFTNHVQIDFDLSNLLTLLRYFTDAYPPKAKVRGSNPLGCAIYVQNHELAPGTSGVPPDASLSASRCRACEGAYGQIKPVMHLSYISVYLDIWIIEML